MTMRIPLTTTAVQNALCPPGKAKIDLPVIGHANLALRVYATGTKAFYMLYRVGSGRKAQKRADKIPGDATALAIKDVKDAWRAKLGAIAKGGDPAGERKAEAKRERNRIEPALGAYERDLTRRKVVKRDEVMSLLRRELQTPFGNVDLASLTRNDLVKRISDVEASGRPGAARELRKVAAGWCQSNANRSPECPEQRFFRPQARATRPRQPSGSP